MTQYELLRNGVLLLEIPETQIDYVRFFRIELLHQLDKIGKDGEIPKYIKIATALLAGAREYGFDEKRFKEELNRVTTPLSPEDRH